MGCIYENFQGMCTLYDEDVDDTFQQPQGCEDGACISSDDPDPADSCDSYESDNTCYRCGIDLSVEECTCIDD